MKPRVVLDDTRPLGMNGSHTEDIKKAISFYLFHKKTEKLHFFPKITLRGKERFVM